MYLEIIDFIAVPTFSGDACDTSVRVAIMPINWSMDTPACCAELAVLLIDSAIPPASAAAFISTALSLEITANALSADSL